MDGIDDNREQDVEVGTEIDSLMQETKVEKPVAPVTRSRVRLAWIVSLLCMVTATILLVVRDVVEFPTMLGKAHSVEFVQRLSTNETKRLAYFFYATDDGQACNALIAGKKLRQLGARASIDMVAMVSEDVSQATQNHLYKGGVIPMPVERWRRSTGNAFYKDALTKLRLFEERGYDRVVYIDSDTVIQRNLDVLFDLPHAIFWAPRAYWLDYLQPFITSVLLVVDPNNALFAHLEHAIAVEKEPQYDMDVLNNEWKHQCGILPSEFVVLSTHLQSDTDKFLFGYKDLDDRINHTYIHHFSPSNPYNKPWNMNPNDMVRDPNVHHMYYDLFEIYWNQRHLHCPWLD
ncbi:cleavage induced hypothetical protein [Thraustotheca clavata]|uniref:Nucleotide-diphospho-sugar transferase n=1 Tax=Thraustotheca clavata TaxID=74557 RepID=A0A1W0A050_9STRA|nr:cleavage induced hypothetical protein [Thraustotheca clavata]